jgi:hypothetical protein
MEDHSTLTKTQAKLNITKDGKTLRLSRLVRKLSAVGTLTQVFGLLKEFEEDLALGVVEPIAAMNHLVGALVARRRGWPS